MYLDENDLKKMQSEELEIFKKTIEICERLNLRYFLLGGTLLGAVRHEGFIPWDDDIDIGMFREDYEIFISEAPKHLPENYFLQTHKSESSYINNFAKIRNSETTFIESAAKNLNINHGIFIDIFPLDFYPETNLKRIIFKIKNWIYQRKLSEGFYVKTKKTLKTRVIDSIFHKIFCKLDVYETVAKREKLFKSCSNSTKIANHCGAWGEKEVVPIEWYGEGKTLMFEGICVNVPQDYESWLNKVYGNYMQLPPIEKRVTHHHTEIIDLEKSYIEYM